MSDPTGHGAFAAVVSTDLPVPAVALAVGAHPDDVDFGCGGTLAKWAAAGCEIHHLVLTDGSKGSWDPSQDQAALIATRQDEQRQASVELGGGGRVVFLGLVDGELEETAATRAQIAFWIRKIRPAVVLGHDPWKRYRLHPDHRHAGFLTIDGIVGARDPFFYPDQGVPPHRPEAILLWEADAPDHAESIAGYEDRKLQALLAHRSQFRSTMKIGAEPAERETFAARMVERHRAAGAAAGLAAAEAFKLIRDV